MKIFGILLLLASGACMGCSGDDDGKASTSWAAIASEPDAYLGKEVTPEPTALEKADAMGTDIACSEEMPCCNYTWAELTVPAFPGVVLIDADGDAENGAYAEYLDRDVLGCSGEAPSCGMACPVDLAQSFRVTGVLERRGNGYAFRYTSLEAQP